ncbi:MAG: hypothetical protein Q4D62_15700 [Planctomycetia bacterium]|nr:hypothetical protein [Planctomycetia bacterium]
MPDKPPMKEGQMVMDWYRWTLERLNGRLEACKKYVDFVVIIWEVAPTGAEIRVYHSS